MFSIIIPTYNNIEYLKLIISSIKKNSKYNHEIIVHVNEGTDGTLDFIKKNNIKHTYSKENIGLCSSVNQGAAHASTDYILYTHDDMYFCPGWDQALSDELININTNLYYISGTMIEQSSGHIQLDCGSNHLDFNEKLLLEKFNTINFFDHQGSHWAPHLIHKSVWQKIGGFSEEFNPGIGSDPDLNMKLWNHGVRIFKGLNKFRVYHFGSVVLRKKKNFKRNKGAKTFLIKWGFTPIFFVKHFLRGGVFKSNKIICKKFYKPLDEPYRNFSFYIDLLVCKIKLYYLKLFKF